MWGSVELIHSGVTDLVETWNQQDNMEQMLNANKSQQSAPVPTKSAMFVAVLRLSSAFLQLNHNCCAFLGGAIH